MAKNKYDYILYKANGEKVVIGRGIAKKSFDEIREILHCDFIEMVPKEYIDPELDADIDQSKCGWFYMDEEARLKEETNIRNNFFMVIEVGVKEQKERAAFAENMGFDVITGMIPKRNGVEEWDIVGDVLMEKRVNG